MFDIHGIRPASEAVLVEMRALGMTREVGLVAMVSQWLLRRVAAWRYLVGTALRAILGESWQLGWHAVPTLPEARIQLGQRVVLSLPEAKRARCVAAPTCRRARGARG